MNWMKYLALTILTIPFTFAFQPLTAAEYGAISGKVTSEKVKSGIPGVVVDLFDKKNSVTTKTGPDGRYSFDKLIPGTYYLNFLPEPPYCSKWDNHEVRVNTGKISVFDKTLDFAGTLKGNVYKSDGKTPFEGVSVRATTIDGSSKNAITTPNGSFFIDGLCSSNKYNISVCLPITGSSSYTALKGISVKKGAEKKLKDIIFDLNEVTGVEGYVTSFYDQGPLENINISIGGLGTSTGKNGYYHITGLEPGDYLILFMPPVPPGKDEVTGRPMFNPADLTRYIGKVSCIVREGRVEKIDHRLYYPSFSSIIKTRLDIRMKFEGNPGKMPDEIILKGVDHGTPRYTKRKIINAQLNYNFDGISPGNYHFGLRFQANTGEEEDEEEYYTSPWNQGDDKIYIPWEYRVIIDVVFISRESCLQENGRIENDLRKRISVDIIEVRKKRKEKTFYYKIEITREIIKLHK